MYLYPPQFYLEFSHILMTFHCGVWVKCVEGGNNCLKPTLLKSNGNFTLFDDGLFYKFCTK